MSQLSSSAQPMQIVLPKSTLQTELTSSEPTRVNSWKHDYCPRTFKTDRGRNQHQNKCRTSVFSGVVRIQPSEKFNNLSHLLGGRIHWRTLNSSSMQRTMKLSIGEITFSCCNQVRQENCLSARPLDYLRCG